ncbi:MULTISPECIES: Mce protein [unclassified Mycobacterium]|uniref:Mce protein n=1 Tax=unclassified Mycobacterium TaxID=2642494 RepID=UPI00080174C4|nr:MULTISPECIES: Mce protein [unclassified Mycobacterium]OBG71542.1 Mce protein [Mycobacterium sp. E1214]OBH27651.1 Mce protein [Mycobacterium sp. E1319]
MADEPDTAAAAEKDETDAADESGVPDESAVTDESGVPDESAVTDESGVPDGRIARWRNAARTRRLSRVATALVAGVLIVATLAGVAGYWGYRAYQTHTAQARRDLYLQTARQGAVNLTTIKYTEIDADVQRILELATGAFREDFEQRSKPFMEVVKAAQSKSEGTVTDAGVESEHGDSAQVLVAVAVKSQTAGGEEAPREWRMRIEVKSVGDDAKVSNVVFVP